MLLDLIHIDNLAYLMLFDLIHLKNLTSKHACAFNIRLKLDPKQCDSVTVIQDIPIIKTHLTENLSVLKHTNLPTLHLIWWENHVF